MLAPFYYAVVSEFWCCLTLEVTCYLQVKSVSHFSPVPCWPWMGFSHLPALCLGIYPRSAYSSMLCAQLVGVDVGVPCSMSSYLGKPGPPLPLTLVRSTRRDVSLGGLGGLGGLMMW